MTAEERRIITIRGISMPVYERALRLARELGITIGELVNEALKRYITTLEAIHRAIESHLENLARAGDVVIVSNIDYLKVKRKDLEAVPRKIVFKDIRELEFDEDVTEDLFNEKVYEIVRVDKVVVPKTLSTLLVASKCKLVHKITHKE
ncbi:MAG: hypothetical protein GXO23_03665 [Crenarchaeota archaeon]|nr:hypothetical protein [Thermoproteota archaeon]